MQPISLIKRVLYYLFLSLISLTAMIIGSIFVLGDPANSLHDYRNSHYFSVILTMFLFLIPQYIFGLIFLRTKWIFKLIIPIVTSSVSFGCILLMGGTCNLNLSGTVCMLLLPAVFAWEIAYQVLTFCCLKFNSSIKEMWDKN